MEAEPPEEMPAMPAVGGHGWEQEYLPLHPGFWFGYNFRFNMEVPEIFGCYMRAKRTLKRCGESRPQPVLFAGGGDISLRRPLQNKGWGKGQPLATLPRQEQRLYAAAGA